MSNASEAISVRTKAALAAAKAPGERLGTPARAGRRGTLAPLFVSNHVSVLRKWARVSPAISAVAIVAERAFAA